MTLPTDFVVFVSVMAASALAAVVAPARPGWLGIAAAALATVPNELALVAFVLLGQSTWAAITEKGLLATSLGCLLLMVAIGTEVLFVILLARGLRSRTVVARALTATYGKLVEAKGTRSIWRTLLTPLPIRPWRIERIANRSYGPEGRRNRLDLYRRRTRHRREAGNAPVLVYLHGGGYFSGSKRRDARALLHHFADQGWICVAATYRLLPWVRWPEHLIDVKRVLAWVRDHAAEYGADASTMVLAGSSAGAHLAAVAALSPNEPAFQPGFEDADTTVSAVVGLYGYYGLYYGRSACEEPSSSPLLYDAAAAPPFFVAHGDRDSYTPVSLARALVGKLRAESPSAVVYAELPGGQHGFDLFRSPRSDAVIAGIEAFTGHVTSSRRDPHDNPPGEPGCSTTPTDHERLA